MTHTPTPLSKTEEKPWIWTSLGTAAIIVLCCGIAPVAVIAGIEVLRDSSSINAGKGGAVVTKSPRGTSPQALPPSVAPAPVSPSPPQATPSPPLEPPLVPPPEELPAQEPPAEQPAAEQPPIVDSPAQDPPLQAFPESPPQMPAEAMAPETTVPSQEVMLPQPAQAARIGETVRAGELEFVVREVRCGLKQIGSDAGGPQAQGHFCLVTISVRNLGLLTQSLLEGAQKGIGANGSEYGTNPTAGLAANGPDNQNWLSGIDPGEEVSGFVVFELPDGVNLAQVVLTGGISVSTG